MVSSINLVNKSENKEAHYSQREKKRRSKGERTHVCVYICIFGKEGMLLVLFDSLSKTLRIIYASPVTLKNRKKTRSDLFQAADLSVTG